MADNDTKNKDYLDGLENLQYDILYGKRYCEEDGAVFKSDMVMGIEDVKIRDINKSTVIDSVYINGENFTKWSYVYVNGEKVNTTYVSGNTLRISPDDLEDGDTVVVNQLGSSSTIFRSSNEFVYKDNTLENNTEDSQVTEETEETEQN